MTRPNTDDTDDTDEATLIGDDAEQIITSTGDRIDPDEDAIPVASRAGGAVESRRGGEVFVRNPERINRQ